MRLLSAAALCTLITLVACAAKPPENPNNLCNIFEEKRGWYKASKKAAKKWDSPMHVPMAILFQESSFKAKAKPPRRYVLGIIPAGRVSSARGYSQAKSPAWQDYKRATGNRGADRDNFADSIDFVHWYMSKSQQVNGVSKWDAQNQYLNYHEGWGGYQRGSYKQKAWLIEVAAKVDKRSRMYAEQYQQCKKKLDKGWFSRIF